MFFFLLFPSNFCIDKIECLFCFVSVCLCGYFVGYNSPIFSLCYLFPFCLLLFHVDIRYSFLPHQLKGRGKTIVVSTYNTVVFCRHQIVAIPSNDDQIQQHANYFSSNPDKQMPVDSLCLHCSVAFSFIFLL